MYRRGRGYFLGLLAILSLLLTIVPTARAGEGRVFPREPEGRGVLLEDVHPDDEFYPVSINNWWGLMNQQGSLVVYPQFEWADHSFDGRTRVVVDGKTGFISGGSQWLIKPRLPYADRYANNVAIVGDGKHYGFIDKAANVVAPVRFDGALRFRDGMAAVRIDDRCGFINRKGELVIGLRFVRSALVSPEPGHGATSPCRRRERPEQAGQTRGDGLHRPAWPVGVS